MFRASILTLFPELFPGSLSASLIGKAMGEKWSLEAINLRDFSFGKHRQVDDTPSGGGPGMVMRADVVAAAVDHLNDLTRPRLVMSPRGMPLKQAQVREWANGEGLIILCGRFEGIDERVLERRNFIPVSIGDFVLSGGEVAALTLLEATLRLLPGVMGHDESGTSESYENGLLEYPHYTRPQEFEGQTIPEVLTSGDHKKVEKWRLLQSEELTKQRRPDLFALYQAQKNLTKVGDK